jgi:hypothetical protein
MLTFGGGTAFAIRERSRTGRPEVADLPAALFGFPAERLVRVDGHRLPTAASIGTSVTESLYA